MNYIFFLSIPELVMLKIFKKSNFRFSHILFFSHKLQKVNLNEAGMNYIFTALISKITNKNINACEFQTCKLIFPKLRFSKWFIPYYVEKRLKKVSNYVLIIAAFHPLGYPLAYLFGFRLHGENFLEIKILT